MSDQDFFFEDEEPEAAEEKLAAKKPAVKKPAAGTGAAKTAAKPLPKTAAKAVPASSESFFDQQINVAVATLIAIIALLVGVIGGYMFASASTSTQIPAASVGGVTAPQLTPEQLNSGQLPQGHPTIPGGGSTPATPTK